MTFDDVRRICRKHGWAAYLLAASLIGLAFATRIAAWSVFKGYPFLLFFPGIMLSAYFGGRRPGYFAVALAVVLAWYVFLDPHLAFFPIRPAQAISLVLFAAVAIFDVEIVVRLNSVSDKAKANAEHGHALFLELKHRIANNLQMVASLLSLQRQQATSNEARAIIDDAIRRIRLVSDIHRNLYEPGRTSIDARRFLSKLAEDIGASLADRPIATDIRIDGAWNADIVIPLSMIVQELLSNALAHGGHHADAEVFLSLTPADPGRCRLTVEDRGPGMPQGFEPAQSKRLGIRLIRGFAQQIGATVAWLPRQGGGTSVVVDLPAP